MTKSKTLALLAVVAMLITLPAVALAQAQPPRPAVFGGTATLDGAAVADGTTVTAEIDGTEVASIEVTGGTYAFSISQPPGQSFAGKEITFKIGDFVAKETGVWNADGGAELNLTATTAVPPTVPPVTPTPAPVTPTAAPVTPTAAPVTPTAVPVTPTAAPVTPTAIPVTVTPATPTTAAPGATTPASATPTPPTASTPAATPAAVTAVYGGTATIAGGVPADGFNVTAFIAGTLVASSKVSGGKYSLSIAEPASASSAGNEITFKVSYATATKIPAWTAAGDDKLDLSLDASLKNRFISTTTDTSILVSPGPTPNSTNVCVPKEGFNTHGFYFLSNEPTEVNLGLYTRLQYYSLTPGPVGNIPTFNGGKDFTNLAHRHGIRVDLVISASEFNTSNSPTDPGLRLAKSYVLLNMVDEIVDAVNSNNFDGVTIDFRVPGDKADRYNTARQPDAGEQATRDAFTFFIKRLKSRLNEGAVSPKNKRDQLIARAKRLDILKDLLVTEPPQLNILLDSSFLDSAFLSNPLLSASLKSDPETSDLGKFLEETFESIDLVLVDGAELKKEVGDILHKIANPDLKTTTSPVATPTPQVKLPSLALILPNDKTLDTRLLAPKNVGIWDVSAAGGDLWGDALIFKVFQSEKLSLNQQVSGYLCTNRNLVLLALTGAAPFLLILLALSWTFEDFPWIRKKLLNNKLLNKIVLWVLLWVVFVVFALLLIGMPSLDLWNKGVYVVVAIFAVSITYIVLTGLTMLGRRDYP
ncbi:MAG: hypothetical protein IID00_01595 [Chloroflexi bacterium]|nr:hypothetical protein [Chloroflexota bacterium]